MKKIFYDHLILLHEINVELDDQELEAEEKEELLAIIDQTLHHQIFDTILTYLPKEYHQDFLIHFHQSPDSGKILDYIQEKTEIDIEKAIRETVEEFKKEILQEICKSKSRV